MNEYNNLNKSISSTSEDSNSSWVSNATIITLLTLILLFMGIALLIIWYSNLNKSKTNSGSAGEFNQSISIDADGTGKKYVVGVSKKGVIFYNLVDDEKIDILESFRENTIINGVSISKDSNRIAVSIYDVLNKNSGIYIYTNSGNGFNKQTFINIDYLYKSNKSMCLSGDGKKLIIGVSDSIKRGKVFIYTFDELTEEWKFTQTYYYPTENIFSIGFSVDSNYDGSIIVVGAPRSGKILIINTTNIPTSTAINTNVIPESYVYYDVVKYDDFTIILYLLDNIVLDFGICVSMDDSGRHIVVGTSGNKKYSSAYYFYIGSFDKANITAAIININFNLLPKPISVNINGDGNIIAVGDMEGEVYIVDTNNIYTYRKLITINPYCIPSLSLNTMGNMIAIADYKTYYIKYIKEVELKEDFLIKVGPNGYKQSVFDPIYNTSENTLRRNNALNFVEYKTNANLAMFINPTTREYDVVRAVSLLHIIFPDKLRVLELKNTQSNPITNLQTINSDTRVINQPEYTQVNLDKYCKQTYNKLSVM